MQINYPAVILHEQLTQKPPNLLLRYESLSLFKTNTGDLKLKTNTHLCPWLYNLAWSLKLDFTNCFLVYNICLVAT